MKNILREYLYSLTTDRRDGFIDRLLKLFLFFLSLIYYIVIKFVSFSYSSGIFKTYKFKCPIISVGNISWGGTGKTPLVEILARGIADCGKKTAILLRGYGEDESRMLSENLPDITILIGKNRIKNAVEAINKYKVDVIVLDDGFQYRRLERDVNIVVIDSINPFGNKKLIPRGILREPLSSLNRADIFFLTKVDVGTENLKNIEMTLEKVKPDALIVRSIHKPIYLYDFRNAERIELSGIKDKDICLVSAIGDPGYFEKIVYGLEAKIILKFSFPDHYNYRNKDIKNIVGACYCRNVNIIVTTEKDSVKLRKFEFQNKDNAMRVLILKIELRMIKNEEKFFDRLAAIRNS